MLDECRVLLVHGLLHLLGYDHEVGVEEATAMAAAERHILDALEWKVSPPLGAVNLSWHAFLLRMLLNVCLLVLLSLTDSEHLGWRDVQGEGLIAAAEGSDGAGMISRAEADDLQSMQSGSNSEASTSYSEDSEALSPTRSRRTPEIKLVCIDMDGDLSDSLLSRPFLFLEYIPWLHAVVHKLSFYPLTAKPASSRKSCTISLQYLSC